MTSEYIPERTPGRRATDGVTGKLMAQITINLAIRQEQEEMIELLKQLCHVKQVKINALEGIIESLKTKGNENGKQ